MKILVVKCGSSTLKVQAIDTCGKAETRKLARAIVDRMLPQYVLKAYYSERDEGRGRMDELMARETDDETALTFDIN